LDFFVFCHHSDPDCLVGRHVFLEEIETGNGNGIERKAILSVCDDVSESASVSVR
jgi:hypothetical protein